MEVEAYFYSTLEAQRAKDALDPYFRVQGPFQAPEVRNGRSVLLEVTLPLGLDRRPSPEIYSRLVHITQYHDGWVHDTEDVMS